MEYNWQFYLIIFISIIATIIIFVGLFRDDFWLKVLGISIEIFAVGLSKIFHSL